MKKEEIPKRFFQNPRMEIARILIDKLTKWESTTTVSNEEFYSLVDRLAKLLNK